MSSLSTEQVIMIVLSGTVEDFQRERLHTSTSLSNSEFIRATRQTSADLKLIHEVRASLIPCVYDPDAPAYIPAESVHLSET